MSVIPFVLDAIVDALQGSADLAAVLGPGAADRVLDGPAVADLSSPDGVAVGASRQDESIAFQWPAADLVGIAQHFNINCLAWSGTGSTTFTVCRARVDRILEAVSAALAEDRTLGGLVSQAWITNGLVTQEQTGRGALVVVEFQITVDRF